MKKILTIISILLFTIILFSCNLENKKYTVITPTGTPQIALSFLYGSQFEVTSVNGSELVSAAFASKEYDVIVAPTNLGAKLHNNNYQLASTFIWGSLYICSFEQHLSLSELEGKTIYAFSPGTTNDILLNYILNENEINANIEYLANVEEVRSHLILNPSDIGVLAEPQISVMQYQIGGFNTVIDLAAEYYFSTGKMVPQASFFVKSKLKDNVKKYIANKIVELIGLMLVDYSASADKAIESGISIAKEVLINSIPNMKIWTYSVENERDYLNYYFELLYDTNPNLVGTIPGDSFYLNFR